MRLRQRALRGTAAATGAIALVLALAGCVGGETDDGPSGPNGYELGATLDDVTAWVDVSETTGTLDVILERSGESQPVGVCLGGQGTVCLLGQVAEGPHVVFMGPAGEGYVTTLTWNGQPIEMTTLEGVPAESPQVFVAAAPPGDPAATSYSFSVADAAGTVIATQP